MDIPLVPDDPPPPPKKYNSKKKKKSQYGQWKNQSSSAVSHHQGVEQHRTLAIDVLLDDLLTNEYKSQTPNRTRVYDNWGTTHAVLSRDKIIQNENLSRIDVEEILVQNIAKIVAAGDKAHDANERIKHAEHETRQEKHASNILIQDKKKKAHDIMEYTQFMMKESHVN